MSCNRRGGAFIDFFPPEYRQHWVYKGLWCNQTLHDLFDETVGRLSEEVAIIADEERITFADFKERSDALAAGLWKCGVRAGEIVTVQLPNWPEFCFLQIALSRIGAVIHPMHTTYREREMEKMLSFCESATLITPTIFGGFDFRAAAAEIRRRLPSLRRVITVRGTGGDHELTELFTEGEFQTQKDPDQVFYLNFTSGTEGDPKGFLHTHNTLISFFKIAAAFMKFEKAVNLTCSPMTHSFGHFTTYQTAIAGIPMVLVEKFDPGKVLHLIESEGVTTLLGTPAHIFSILRHPDFSAADKSSLQSINAGGARSSPELIAEIELKLGIKAGNTYGMGENLVHTRTMPFDPPEKIQSTVGRPLPTTELKIVDPAERDRELGAGEVGEIVFRGPTLFAGYLKQPELTASTRDDEGWFYTGDLGYVDSEGYLCFVGRSSEVINRGGTKIYPKEIEDLLGSHSAIKECAVVPMPDARLGEISCAFVVASKYICVDEIVRFVKASRASNHMIPDRVILLDELPMTPTGKVRKASLVEEARLIARIEAGEEHPPRPNFMSDEEWQMLTTTRNPKLVRAAGVGHAKAYLNVSGENVDRTQGGPVLVLTMTGRKSGKEVSTCLNYVELENSYVVVGSFAGFAKDPNWVLNLRSNSDAVVTIRDKSTRVKAREISGEDRAKLWPKLVEQFPLWGHFQRYCSREFPVFILEPEAT